jgi:hypothetical protein
MGMPIGQCYLLECETVQWLGASPEGKQRFIKRMEAAIHHFPGNQQHLIFYGQTFS